MSGRAEGAGLRQSVTERSRRSNVEGPPNCPIPEFCHSPLDLQTRSIWRPNAGMSLTLAEQVAQEF